jgi:hypothetical protein
MPVDLSTGIFYETQSGGLCRMHSLNAFFGHIKITAGYFQKCIAVYDAYLKKRFNVSTSSATFDLTNSDQTNLVSFILKRHKVHARYYALNTVHGKPLDPEVEKAEFVFVYNADHIWGIRKLNGKHYKVDSMKGVQPFNIQCLMSMRDIGILVPVPLKYEWNKKIDVINAILDKESVLCKKQLVKYLTRLHKKKEILGCLEIPMGVAMSILETNLSSSPNPEFKRITDLVTEYNSFLEKFTDGQYNNLDLILEYVPDIIFKLVLLQ